ncbi:hypothetical protein ABZ942_32835 [Nocardia sp. NPDC046473]|uniref:hypothetical protein n=1 Tax=Nocardia sp. NPDC046473 TaxID=3155733 RepID=UPI0033DB7DC9
MLDLVYSPVSAVLLAGHLLFGAVLGNASGVGWVLAVLVTVFVFRLCMFPLAVLQTRPLTKHEIGTETTDPPQFPLVSFTTRLVVQIVLFIGLLQVWKSFDRTGRGVGQLGMSLEQNASSPNYLFSADDVQAMLSSRLFGAPLVARITTPRAELRAFALFGGAVSTPAIALVALTVAVATATLTVINGSTSPLGYFARHRVRPTPLLNAISRWVLPVLVVLAGLVLPIGMLVYLLGNSACTWLEHRVLTRRLTTVAPAHDDPRSIGRTADGEPIYPVIGYTAAGAPVTANQAAPGTLVHARTNSMAVVALVLGVCAGPLAIPFGHVARSQIRRTREHGVGRLDTGLPLARHHRRPDHRRPRDSARSHLI